MTKPQLILALVILACFWMVLKIARPQLPFPHLDYQLEQSFDSQAAQRALNRSGAR